MKRRDRLTPDLFDWQPPKVTIAFAAEPAGVNRIGSRISRAVGLALAGCGKSRVEVARLMSEELGTRISPDMLDAYASEAKEGHRITLERFIALVTVTGAHELIGFVAGLFDLVVVPERYAALLELHEIEEHEREVARRKQAVEARWKGSR